MNYKLFKKSLVGLLIVGGVAGATVAATTMLAPTNSTPATSVVQMQNESFEKIANFSIRAKDPIANTYTLTINNKDRSKGEVTFEDGSYTKENLKAGDTVSIHVSILNTDYTVQSVRVHALSNVNADSEGNDNCGVYKISETQYQFTLPSETNALGEPNPFYDGNPNLAVDVA